MLNEFGGLAPAGVHPGRLIGKASLSKKWTLADERGSIGVLASTHLGIPPFLNSYIGHGLSCPFFRANAPLVCCIYF
jgi:hypothetical protein